MKRKAQILGQKIIKTSDNLELGAIENRAAFPPDKKPCIIELM